MARGSFAIVKAVSHFIYSMSRPVPRWFAVVIPVFLGELLFAIGLAVSVSTIVMGKPINLRAVVGTMVGAVLLAAANMAVPTKRPPVYAFFLRPLALACLTVVAAGLRLWLTGEAVPPSVATAVPIATCVGVGAVLRLRQVNARTKRTAA
jgi:hypothetical protein